MRKAMLKKNNNMRKEQFTGDNGGVQSARDSSRCMVASIQHRLQHPHLTGKFDNHTNIHIVLPASSHTDPPHLTPPRPNPPHPSLTRPAAPRLDLTTVMFLCKSSVTHKISDGNMWNLQQQAPLTSASSHVSHSRAKTSIKASAPHTSTHSAHWCCAARPRYHHCQRPFPTLPPSAFRPPPYLASCPPTHITSPSHHSSSTVQEIQVIL